MESEQNNIVYEPSHVANYMLRRGKDEKRAITQMKLQKLVYIAFGWVLAVLDRRLFGEQIVAWQHGPVIESLYHEFKHFGARPLDERSIKFDLDSLEETIPEIDLKDEPELSVVLDKVWGIYNGFSAGSLRNMTHKEGTPWYRATDGGKIIGVPIEAEYIKEHFKGRIRQYLDELDK